MSALEVPWQAAVVCAWLPALTALGGLAGWVAERRPGARPIFAVPLGEGQLRHELVGNLLVHGIAWICFGGALGAGLIRLGPFSPGNAALTFLACWGWFEAWFYVMHRALHHRSLVRFHAWHHVSHVTTPWSGFSLHPVEALGWMVGYLLPPIVLSTFTTVGAEAWLLYLAYHWAGNVFGHSNVEVVAPWVRARWASWGVHPFVYHALHHARWTTNYGLYTTFLDRLLGTESPEWPDAHREVWERRPMTELRPRRSPLADPSAARLKRD